MRTLSQWSFAKKKFQNTTNQGYFVGIKFLMHDKAKWDATLEYYATKFGVIAPGSNKHCVLDARFCSEDVFYAAMKCGWNITQSMKSNIPDALWRVMEANTKRDHYLVLENNKKGILASCFCDGTNTFCLWTTAYSVTPND